MTTLMKQLGLTVGQRPARRSVKEVKAREQSNGRTSIHFRAPDAHRGGVMPRCHARIGTEKVTGNGITCVRIERGAYVFEQAQVKIELYSDDHGSYAVGTDQCEYFSGTFSSVKRKTTTLQFGSLRLIFEDTAAQRKAWKTLQKKIKNWKQCC